MATPATPVAATATNTNTKGTVVFVQGDAYLRDSSGKLTAIKPGDVVAEGDAIVTAAGAVVELQLPSGAKLSVGPDRELLLNDELFATAVPERSENVVSSLGAEADKVIQALNSGKDPFEDLEDPAAGLAGGGVGDQTHDFVRLVRILEDVTPISYSYSGTTDSIDFRPVSGATTATTAAAAANTPPVANPDTGIAATEDKPVTFAVLGNDTDANGDALTVTGATVDPAKGSVTVNADGTLTFTPAANVNGPVTVTYTIADGQGGTSTTTATIDIAPVPDAATLGSGSGAVKEDTAAQTTATGTLSITDPDAGEAAFQPQTNTAGNYGHFSIDANGAWTYTLDNTLPAVQALKEGERVTETLIVKSVDGTETTVTIAVTGTNDAPVATHDTATTREDTPVTFNVLGNDTDVDGDPLSVTSASVDPAKGSIAVNPDGTLTFTPAANVNGPVEVTYTINDGKGGQSTATATIDVSSVNHPANIGTGAGTVQEDTTLLASGTLAITDADPGEAAFQTQAGTPGTYGSFSITAAGQWTYTLDNGNPLVQNLAQGDSRSETFTVKSIDGTESTVVVTILGLNEVIGAPGVGIVKEDNPIFTNGVLTASGGASFVAQPSTPGAYGNLTLNPDGSWTYTLDNPSNTVQSLGEGQTRTETFPVSLTDGTTSTITITVVGTNDPAIVDQGRGNVIEDTTLGTGGKLTVTDVDAGEAAFRPQSGVEGQYGSFTLDAAGNWTYALHNDNPAVQALGAGDTLTESFTVATIDGTPSKVTITIDGTNDAPVVTPDSKTTPEDQPISGALTATDPDGDPLTFVLKDGPANGTVSVQPDGTYTYTPNHDYNGPDSFTVTVSDGKGGSVVTTVSLTVTPLNDDPVARNDANSLVKTDTVEATGNVITNPAGTDTDVDGDTLVVSIAGGVPVSGATVISGLYGTLTINADGNYSYIQNTANPAVAGLPKGATLQDDFTYTVNDGHGGSANAILSITITGANTPPVANPDLADTAEDTAVKFAVLGNDTDPEGDPLTVTQALVDPTKGSVVINPDGTLTFTPAANVNGPVEITYTISDGQGGLSTTTATVNVAAVNDAPVAANDAGAVAEDATLVVTAANGVIASASNTAGTDTDVDGGPLAVSAIRTGLETGSGTAGTVGSALAGTYGTLTLNSDGSYTYVADKANALALGATADDVFTYTVSDGKGGFDTAELRIAVTGTNDAPVAANDSGAVAEDATLTVSAANGVISGPGTDTDVDGGPLAVSAIRTGLETGSGTAGTVGSALAGTYGTLTLNSDGSYTYVADKANALALGATADDVFTYTVSDGKGGFDTAELHIAVTGTNDAPVVGTANVSVSEEGLAGGIADTTALAGSSDTTNLTSASGVLSLSDADGNALNATLVAPTTALTSGGVAITWTGSGSKTLIGSAGGVEILRATIADDGNYSVKLSGPIDHANTAGEDVRSIALGVNVSDGIATTASSLTINIEDDAPVASAITQNIAVAPVDSNLLIMLDVSASMIRTDGVGGSTRLQTAINALNALLDRYDEFGEVRVRLVTFSSTAAQQGDTWTTVADAKAQLAALSAVGGTNYDAALAAGQTAYASTGKLASGQNIAYFLSDGQPNSGTDIGTADEAAWKTFLQNNQITTFALGMGTGAAQTPLDPIAYNGATGTNLNGQVISDFNQLSSALQATVPQPASGELLSGGLLGTSGFGADGGHILNLTVDGVTYTYNPVGNAVTTSGGTSHGTYDAATHQIVIATATGGSLRVNLDTGSYTYTPIATITTLVKDGFSFTLIDNDGDTANSSVTFDVSRQAENVVNLTSTTTRIAATNLGLTGEYYGYNETVSGSNTRLHADDTKYGNFDHVSDMVGIVDGRSGQQIIGTYNAATATGADATFSADKIDYGFGYTTGTTTVGAVNGNLGNNPTVGANLAINSGALYDFLRGNTTGADTAQLHTTTGIGNTTDSGMRMVGLVNLDGGSYDIRVTADDGFRLNIAGQTVAMFDNIQSPTARIYSNVSLASGLQPIEILYWEQGGNARLRVEVKHTGEADTAYKTLGTDDFALFTPSSAPTLNALQDIIEDPNQNGHWLVRTGAQLTGSAGNDDITGSDGRDNIAGGSGNDIIHGGGAADIIAGGAGNDTLTGGLGADTFKWNLGDAGTTAKPAVDAITDFNTASPGNATSGGDVLDLRDLLQGELHTGNLSGNLGNYLHFEKSGADTVVHVSTNGGYTGGSFVAGATDQKIVLQGVDLTNSGALSNDTQIIQDLLTKGKLSAD